MSLADIQSMKALKLAKNSYRNNKGNGVIAIGDSITGGAYDKVNSACSDNSWFHQSVIRSNGLLRFIFNAGVPGERTDQMLNRLQADVLDKNPDICFIFGGTNDVIQGISPYVAIDNIEQMIKKLINKNIKVILCTIPPQTLKTVDVPLFNSILIQMSYKYRLTLLDFYKILVDPSTGGYKSGYSDDGIHPTMTATKLMGDYVVNTLLPKLDLNIIDLPSHNLAGSSNLAPKGLFLTDTNLDGVGDSWSSFGSGIGTYSTATDPSIIGKYQVINKTGSADSCNISTTFSTGYSTGDKIAFMGRVSTSVESGSCSAIVQLRFSGPGNTIRPLSSWKSDIEGTFYMEATVPAGTTGITISVTVGSGTGVVKIGQVGVINLTQLRY